jgi:2-polyprenyl-6-methoxyphenol hydroxylase-like FAD-dependent oxidoreductase
LSRPLAPRAIVVGAGIAGLASARALEGLGYEVRVLERHPQLRSEGAGLTLWPNAVRALEAIGLGDVVEECGHRVSEAVTLTPRGELLATVPLRRIERRFGPLIGVHRGDLLRALAGRLRTGVEYAAGTRWLDGELYANGERLDAELIVGADGIGSATRGAVAPGIAPRAAGYAAWRGVAASGELTPSPASETIGRGKRFGLLPLSGERTYWFAVLAGDRPDADLQDEFAAWHEPIAQVLAATPEAARTYLHLHDLPSLPRWHRGRVVLVGDAAHAMTPNLGQGAAQALEGVAVLADRLRVEPLPDALAAYERARKPRAERIVRRSRAIGRVAQASNPLAACLRDSLARHTPAALTARQLSQVLDFSVGSPG